MQERIKTKEDFIEQILTYIYQNQTKTSFA